MEGVYKRTFLDRPPDPVFYAIQPFATRRCIAEKILGGFCAIERIATRRCIAEKSQSRTVSQEGCRFKILRLTASTPKKGSAVRRAIAIQSIHSIGTVSNNRFPTGVYRTSK
jgi:hypothetical protein